MKVTRIRTLTARDIKIALARYVRQEFNENIRGYKFHDKTIPWIVKHAWRWPPAQMRMINILVDDNEHGIPPGLTAEEVYGVPKGGSGGGIGGVPFDYETEEDKNKYRSES